MQKYRPPNRHPECRVPPPQPIKRKPAPDSPLQARLYGRKWAEYRLAFLGDPANHYCVKCLNSGKQVFAQVIDHVYGYRRAVTEEEARRLFWLPTNHRALCKSCHDYATYWFDGGRGRPVDTPGKLKWYGK